MRTEVVCEETQVDDRVLDRHGSTECVVLRTGPAVDEPGLSFALEGVQPVVAALA